MTAPTANDVQSSAKEFLASISAELREISLQVHSHPEPGLHEVFAHDLITRYLKTKESEGIVVAPSAAQGLDTAFVATFEHGLDERTAQADVTTVGFCSEYDALPIGHACGHNLIAISGIGAFLTTAHLMRQFCIPGRLKLFGTPAEEGVGGKIDMIRAGDFLAVDFAMMLHPGNVDLNLPCYLASTGFDVEYFGRESHAASAPWEGINALDAMIDAYNAIARLRQQLRPTDRVHGIITDGGAAANMIPAYTSSSFMVRAQTVAQLQRDVLPRVLACFKAATEATGCVHAIKSRHTYEDLRTNSVLAAAYARAAHEQLNVTLPIVGDGAGATPLDDANAAAAMAQQHTSVGSTDFGNVSHAVPGLHCVVDLGITADIHSREFLEHARTPEAHARMLDRMACLVATAYVVLTDAALRARARAEFDAVSAQATRDDSKAQRSAGTDAMEAPRPPSFEEALQHRVVEERVAR